MKEISCPSPILLFVAQQIVESFVALPFGTVIHSRHALLFVFISPPIGLRIVFKPFHNLLILQQVPIVTRNVV